MVRVVALLLREYRGTPARGVVRGATVSAWTWLPCFVRKRACAVLSCESVEALAVKFGRTRFCLPQRAAGPCRSARGRCVGRARVVGVRARQLFSEWLLFLFAARAGRRSAAKTPGSGQATDLRLQMTKFVCLRARLRAVRRRAICSPSLVKARPANEVFHPNATHASARASLRVAGVLWRFIAGLMRAEAHSRVPVHECRSRLATARSRLWGSLRPWIEDISDISRSPPKSLSSWAYQLRASTK